MTYDVTAHLHKFGMVIISSMSFLKNLASQYANIDDDDY